MFAQLQSKFVERLANDASIRIQSQFFCMSWNSILNTIQPKLLHSTILWGRIDPPTLPNRHFRSLFCLESMHQFLDPVSTTSSAKGTIVQQVLVQQFISTFYIWLIKFYAIPFFLLSLILHIYFISHVSLHDLIQHYHYSSLFTLYSSVLSFIYFLLLWHTRTYPPGLSFISDSSGFIILFTVVQYQPFVGYVYTLQE